MEVRSPSVSIFQAARSMGLSQNDLCQLMRQGHISTQLVNGQRVLSQGSIQDYQARKKHDWEQNRR